jgi:hypothetical protein
VPCHSHLSSTRVQALRYPTMLRTLSRYLFTKISTGKPMAHTVTRVVRLAFVPGEKVYRRSHVSNVDMASTLVEQLQLLGIDIGTLRDNVEAEVVREARLARSMHHAAVKEHEAAVGGRQVHAKALHVARKNVVGFKALNDALAESEASAKAAAAAAATAAAASLVRSGRVAEQRAQREAVLLREQFAQELELQGIAEAGAFASMAAFDASGSSQSGSVAAAAHPPAGVADGLAFLSLDEFEVEGSSDLSHEWLAARGLDAGKPLPPHPLRAALPHEVRLLSAMLFVTRLLFVDVADVELNRKWLADTWRARLELGSAAGREYRWGQRMLPHFIHHERINEALFKGLDQIAHEVRASAGIRYQGKCEKFTSSHTYELLNAVLRVWNGTGCRLVAALPRANGKGAYLSIGGSPPRQWFALEFYSRK